jgi:hypothetical protein
MSEFSASLRVIACFKAGEDLAERLESVVKAQKSMAMALLKAATEIERLQNELYARSDEKRGAAYTNRATLSDEEHERNGAVAGCETVCPHVRGTVTQHCSLNFTITDEEREAISEVVDCLTETGTALANATTTRNTLADLLERLK